MNLEDSASVLPESISEDSYEKHPSFNLPLRPLIGEELVVAKKLILSVHDRKIFE